MLLATPTGRRLSDAIPGGSSAIVPELYFAEVAAALRRMELGGAVSADRSAFAIRRLLTLGATRVQVKPLLAEAWTLRYRPVRTSRLASSPLGSRTRVAWSHPRLPAATARSTRSGRPAVAMVAMIVLNVSAALVTSKSCDGNASAVTLANASEKFGV